MAAQEMGGQIDTRTGTVSHTGVVVVVVETYLF